VPKALAQARIGFQDFPDLFFDRIRRWFGRHRLMLAPRDVGDRQAMLPEGTTHSHLCPVTVAMRSKSAS
jgi:hypothetical protein